MSTQDDLASILDSALDEFDEEVKLEPQKSISTTPVSAPSTSAPSSSAFPSASSASPFPNLPDDAALSAMFSSLLSSSQNLDSDTPNPNELAQLLELAMKSGNFEALSGESANSTSGNNSGALNIPAAVSTASANTTTNDQPLDPLASAVRMLKEGLPKGPSDIPTDQLPSGFENDMPFLKDMESMFQAFSGMQSDSTSAASGSPDAASLSAMFNALGSGGAGGNDSQMIETMMTMLLAKDHFYEPMRDFTRQFEEFLRKSKETNSESKYSSEDWERFDKQLERFRQILIVYETEPSEQHAVAVTQLLSELEALGSPPAEIAEQMPQSLLSMPSGTSGNSAAPECSIM